MKKTKKPTKTKKYIAVIGANLRNELGVTPDEQKKQIKKYAALNAFVAVEIKRHIN